MTKILLDENVAFKIKEDLIKLGFEDVKHIDDFGKGLADEDVFNVAKDEERILISGDDDFKKKFEASKGLCLKHFEKLARASEKYLSGKSRAEFLNFLIEKELSELERIQDDIHKFTLKFDYRNKDMEWGTAEDAPIRTVEKVAGFIDN